MFFFSLALRSGHAVDEIHLSGKRLARETVRRGSREKHRKTRFGLGPAVTERDARYVLLRF